MAGGARSAGKFGNGRTIRGDEEEEEEAAIETDGELILGLADAAGFKLKILFATLAFFGRNRALERGTGGGGGISITEDEEEAIDREGAAVMEADEEVEGGINALAVVNEALGCWLGGLAFVL